MSRGDYDRVVADLDDADRQRFDRIVEVYPEQPPAVPVTADQERIGRRFTELLDLPLDRPSAPPGPPNWIWPRGNGKTSAFARARDAQLRHARDPAVHWEWQAPDWMQLDDLIEIGDEPAAGRYFLNNVVEATERSDADRDRFFQYLVVDPDAPPGIVTTAPTPATTASSLDMEQIMDFMRAWANATQAATRPRRRLLKAGANAIAAIAATGRPARRGWAKDVHGAAGALVELTGIPIVPDPDLPPDNWRLVDPDTDEVLYEGTVDGRLDEYYRVAREHADKVADEAGIPRDLLH